jgi:hypothetical protein
VNSQAQPHVTISVGVVAVEAYRVASHDAAVGLADQALYEAKNKGRDRYVALEPGGARAEPAVGIAVPLRAESPGLREAAGS